MQIRRLECGPDGSVSAILLAGGEELHVNFTTTTSGNITVANPDRNIFANSGLDAQGTREIVAAVIAFDRVAYRPEPIE